MKNNPRYACSPRLKRRSAESLKHSYIWLILLFSLFPLYMVFNISLKTNHQFFNQPWLPTWPFHWENWAVAWNWIAPSIWNTVFLCISTTMLTLVLAVLAAFFFARFHMPGSHVLWASFLTLMLMPSIANLIPLFTLLKELHLLNTFTALILCGASAGQVFTVYVLRNFIEDIPGELFEAAEIDGAGYLDHIIHIVLPMSGSIISTLAILRFLVEWNSFVLPLVVLRDAYKLPLAVRLYQLEGAYVKEWGPMMASYALASVPLVLIFLFTMRLFVKGLSAGAVKG